MMERTLFSGAMMRDLLLCEHRVHLDLRGDDASRDPTSPFVKMLWRDGLAHEEVILTSIPGPVVDLRGDDRVIRERETHRAIADGAPRILGSLIRSGDMIGMPDLLTFTPRGYVALDVKSGSAIEGTAGSYKREYLVQVAHYARILSDLGVGPADACGVVDRDGATVAYDLTKPLGRERKTGIDLHAALLERARDIEAGRTSTRPALSSRCGICDWRSRCRADLKNADDLTLITGLGRAVREQVETIATGVAGLAAADIAGSRRLPGIGGARLARFVERAKLLADPSAGPVAREPLMIPAATHEVDFDVEADPMRGIVYLHGFWHETKDEAPRFVHFFAETPDDEGERDAFARAMDHFRQHRDAQWFHYSAYERTAYRALQRRHPLVCDESEIDAIFAPERCTDLYATVAAKTDWPLCSYGIKSIARSCGFAWEDLDPSGAASIEWYDRHVAGEEGLRERIVAYNRDDVRAGAHVRAALRELDATGSVAAFRRPTK